MRVCTATGARFQPGEKVRSVLYAEDGEIKRDDLCAKAWRDYEKPESAVAWWSWRVGAPEEKRARPTTNDFLVALFESLVFKPDQADLRYVLALLLVRRRVFRFEFENNAQKSSQKEQDSIFVYSSRNDACYATPVVDIDESKIADVQSRLVAILDSPPEEFSNADDVVAKAAAAAAAALENADEELDAAPQGTSSAKRRNRACAD